MNQCSPRPVVESADTVQDTDAIAVGHDNTMDGDEEIAQEASYQRYGAK